MTPQRKIEIGKMIEGSSYNHPQRKWQAVCRELFNEVTRPVCPYPHSVGNPLVTKVDCICGYHYDASEDES